ncbi:MAG: SH3 domain-containing protein [Treponema sp.]|jgi:hypothetical protein|nr:SH3 domain-containing protein [Treponema sp.]
MLSRYGIIRAGLLLAALAALGGCSKTIGWGVTLWYTGAVPSGTVVPVYVRSNIEQAWIVSVPEEYRDPDGAEDSMMEVPLPHLELLRSKGAAERRLAQFGGYAKTYAETLQDGLPIRESPENNARRTYRLKLGEIIKILQKAEGVAAVGTSGSALEGEWFKVMTESGSSGFCFSYRLRLFEHETGSLGGAEREIAGAGGDRDLEILLTRVWYPEAYKAMVDSGRLDLDYLSKLYSFTPGVETSQARLVLENGEQSFPYTKIVKDGDRRWKFEGSMLELTLNSASSLSVSWEADGKRQTQTFVTLPVSVENIVNQEREKRQNRYQAIYVLGPDFQSANFGTLALNSNGRFKWEGMEEQDRTYLGSGVFDMGYYLGGEMADRYTGALAMRFDAVSGGGRLMVFAYILDNQGLRLEHIPGDYVSRRTVSRRAPDPLVISFSSYNSY